jgi:hypothetical protein
MLAMIAWLPGHAGGVFYNSNQSAEYIRSFDRNSAVDGADIAHYNMAGTVNLRPGLTFNVSNQTILQWATVRTLGNPVLGDRSYESGNPVWLVPNLYAAYAAALAAGASPALARAEAAAAGLDGSAFSARSWIKGSSSFLAWRHGCACRLGPRLALAQTLRQAP